MSTHLHTFHDGEQQFDTTLPFISENEAEVARQLLLHQQLSELIGTVPSSLDLSQVQRVLDVGCGVGGWVQEMAGRYPDMEVIGVDRSAYFVEQGQALERDMRNATLLVKDMFALQDTFADGSFDLLHLRFLGGEMAFQRFPALIQSLVKLCRIGGWLVWTEAELPRTNSDACNCLESMVLSGLLKAGRAFAPGYSLQLGIFNWMEHWLREVGCTIVLDSEYAIDVSARTRMHEIFARQVWAFGHQIRRLLLETEVVSVAVFEEMLSQMQREVQAETFRGICPLRMLAAVRNEEQVRLLL